MATVYAGIDVGKDNLVLCLHDAITSWENTPAQVRNLLKTLAAVEDIQVVCEASGGYETALVRACHHAGLKVSVVFPSRVRQFARACGQLAKTDPIDAAMIRRFAQAIGPAADPPPSQQQIDLRELVDRRGQLIADIQRHQQQLADVRLAALRRLGKLTLKRLQRELAAVEALIENLSADEAFEAKVQVLDAIKGIGRTTAMAVQAHLPELGRLNRREVAKLGGLAPFNQDSGRKEGKRHIHGGRGHLRRSLYMAATSVVRSASPLAAAYRAMLAKGKPKKVALTAIMRRLLVIMNAVMKAHLNTPKPT